MDRAVLQQLGGRMRERWYLARNSGYAGHREALPNIKVAGSSPASNCHRRIEGIMLHMGFLKNAIFFKRKKIQYAMAMQLCVDS